MIIKILDDIKEVLIWTNKNELEHVDENYNNFIKEYKNNKYRISKFISGTKDIKEATKQLILNHVT